MPSADTIQGFRFFFYSEEGTEDAHIHVEKDDCEAKFWLKPIRLAKNWGFRSHDLKTARRLVVANRELFLKKYYEHHAKKR
jgi:chitinase